MERAISVFWRLAVALVLLGGISWSLAGALEARVGALEELPGALVELLAVLEDWTVKRVLLYIGVEDGHTWGNSLRATLN